MVERNSAGPQNKVQTSFAVPDLIPKNQFSKKQKDETAAKRDAPSCKQAKSPEESALDEQIVPLPVKITGGEEGVDKRYLVIIV